METQKLLELKEKIKKTLIRDGYHSNMAFLENRTGGMVILSLQMKDKIQMISILRKELQSGQYKSYVFVNEAWMVMAKKGEGMPNIPPSIHPDKVECLVISYQDEFGEKQIYIVKFHREDGIIVIDNEESSDKFGGLFDAWK